MLFTLLFTYKGENVAAARPELVGRPAGDYHIRRATASEVTERQR
jgi:hypothetical protein